MAGSQTVNDPRAEWPVSRGSPSFLIEFGGDLRVAASLQQSIDFRNDLRFGLAHLPGGWRHGQRQDFGGAALKAHLHGDQGFVSEQGDVLEYQAGHALAVAVTGCRIFPEPWEVLGKSQDLRLLFRGDRALRALPLF